jgi:hypothetical protein
MDFRISFCRFHFCKALFAKMKGRFRLGAIFTKKASSVEKRLANILRQYFCLPLLRPNHVYQQVMRLEQELRDLTKELPVKTAEKANEFHIYFVNYWCRHIGPDSFSVFGSDHTTNNRLER